MYDRNDISKMAERALRRLQDLCAGSEHSEGECREKLRKWNIPLPQADSIIESLRHDRFIDDRRFAHAFTTDKVRFSSWGIRKIRMALVQKRVAPAIIAEALEGIDHEKYSENLTHLIQQKVSANPSLLESFEGKSKLYRFALSRGYEPSLITAALQTLR